MPAQPLIIRRAPKTIHVDQTRFEEAARTSSSLCSEQPVSHVPNCLMAPQPMHVGTARRSGGCMRYPARAAGSGRVRLA